MDQRLRELGKILALAGLWAVSGYLIGLALEIIGFDTYRLAIIIASLNVILGMMIFLRNTNDPADERAFFETSIIFSPGEPNVGCLWLMPLIALTLGVSMWIWAIILRLIFPE